MIIFLGILYLLLRTPTVQTFLTDKITNQLSGQLDTEIAIEGVDIDFFDEVVLDGIYVEDRQQDTLLYVERLRVDIGLFNLFNKKILIDRIGLENIYVNLYTIVGTDKMNYAFVMESFASDTTTQQDTTTSAWNFDLRELHLETLRFDYDNKVSETEITLALNSFLLDLETLGLEESHIQVNEININGLDLALSLPPSPADSFQNMTDTLQATSQADTALVAMDTVTTGADSLNPSGFQFTIEDFIIEDSDIEYVAGGKAEKGKINFANLDIENLGLIISDIEVGANNATASIEEFNFLEQNSGFMLQEFALDLNVDMPTVSAELKSLKTGNSQLNGRIALDIPSINDTDSLMGQLKLLAEFNKTIIGLQDVGYFVSALDSMPALAGMNIFIEGKAEVQEGAANINNLMVNMGDQARLQADLAVDDIVNINNAYLDLNISELSTSFDFISKFLPPGSIPPELRNTGGISLTAEAEGNLSNIDLKTKMSSSIGEILANINYKGREDGSFAVRGDINGIDIALQRLTGNDSLGNLTFTSEINAAFAEESIRVDSLNFTIESFKFNNYIYEDLKVSASFIDSLLVVSVHYIDQYLKLNLDALANINSGGQRIALDGAIDINMFRLNLSPDSIILKTAINADVEGLDLDAINGYVRLSDAVLIKGPRRFQIDTVQLLALTTDTARSIRFRSDFIRADLTGQFSFAKLPAAIADFTQRYFTSYKKDSIISMVDQRIKFIARIQENPVLLEAFMPELSIPEPIDIYANYQGASYFLEVDITAPKIAFAENQIQGLVIAAGTENDNVQFEIMADYAVIGADLIIPELHLGGSFIQNMMQFNLSLANSTNPSYLNFNGFLTSQGDTIILDILDSNMAIEGQQWEIPDEGKIVYAPEYLMVNNFLLIQDDQKIALATKNENTDESLLTLNIDNLNIGDLLKIAGMEEFLLQAELNGNATVINPLNLKQANVDFSVSEIVIDEKKMADLNLLASKPADKEIIELDLSMQGPDNNFAVTGSYNLVDTVNSLDIAVDIQKFSLDQWAPFVQDFVTDLSGNIQADMHITGSPNRPVVEGYLAFDPRSIMRIKGIGSLYKLDNQRIVFTQEEITLPNFTIKDSENNEVVIDGTITHQYFSDFVFDLSVNTDEFKFFNAEEKYSPSFYGSVNISANLDITGPMENMVVDGTVKTMEGTSPVIAMVDEPGEVSRAPYIHFINTNAYAETDSTVVDSVALNTTAEISGMTLNLRLRVTPEAILKIVVDPVAGDHLLARGEGDFMINMRPTGEMNVQGTYVMEQGSYALSFMGLIKKEFDIREGSRIILTGNPMFASFNIKAVYHTEASADGLIQIPQGNVEDQARYTVDQPVNVVLILQGTIQDPEISFDIELPVADPYSPIALKIKTIKNNQSQLYQQVFGLIVLNRFIPPSGPIGGGGGGAASVVNQRVDASVSSMLTTQLSRLTGDYLGGVELAVDLESQDPSSTSFQDKDLQIQLSKQINDRITVTVGGTSALGGSGGSGGEIVGNFEILYQINESGTLNLRIFQTNDRDIFTNQFVRRQGISFTYQKSFDEFFEEDEDVLKGELPPEEDIEVTE